MTRRWFTDEECDRAKRLREMGYSYEDIAVRLKTSKGRIGKLAARGWKRHTFGDRQRPTDLAIIAPTMTVKQLREHYQVGGKLLKQWMDEIGVAMPNRQHRHPKRPPPADLAATHRTMTRRQMLKHYNCTSYVLTRWLVETGLPTPRHDYWARRREDTSRVGWAERHAAERRAA